MNEDLIKQLQEEFNILFPRGKPTIGDYKNQSIWIRDINKYFLYDLIISGLYRENRKVNIEEVRRQLGQDYIMHMP